MWLGFVYSILIGVLLLVIIRFVFRYSGTNRMTLSVAVELLKNGGPLTVTPHESRPGAMTISNDAIAIHYVREQKHDGLHEHIRYVPAPHTSYLGGHCIHYVDSLVMKLQRTDCETRLRDEMSFREKSCCGEMMRIVLIAIDRIPKGSS